MSAAQYSRAFVLRSVDQGESNRIITLFTEDFGKITAIARGARNSRRRQLQSLQPFSLLNVLLNPGRGELYRIEEVKIERIYSSLYHDLKRMDVAGYVLSILRDVMAGSHPERKLFVDLAVFFDRLNGNDGVHEELSVVFLRHAFDLLGHAPRFDQCGHCGRRPGANQPVRFDALLGALVCSHCGHGRHELGPRARALLCSDWRNEDSAVQWLQDGAELLTAQQTLTAFAQAQFGRAMPRRLF